MHDTKMAVCAHCESKLPPRPDVTLTIDQVAGGWEAERQNIQLQKDLDDMTACSVCRKRICWDCQIYIKIAGQNLCDDVAVPERKNV